MQDFVAMIANYLTRWNNPFLLEAIFHSADPVTVAQHVDTFCINELGCAIEKTYFFEASQGLAAGFLLKDGRRIVLKAHPPKRSLDFLSAIVQVQRYLADQGYPCPRPLLPPRPLVNGHATVEDLIDEGVYTDAHDPLIRRSLAEALDWLIKLTRRPETIPNLQLSALDLRLPTNQLWPIPHSNIFDFEATTAGAEWIDDLARQAKAIRSGGAGDLVIGHTDWSVKHFRYIDGKVRVIYDWDSLALDKEPAIVGDAARYFTYTEAFNVRPLPTREEAHAFVREYEAARGKPFSADELKTLAATVTYGLAYGARCEHSLHPHENVYPAGSCRALLKRYGNAFLDMQNDAILW